MVVVLVKKLQDFADHLEREIDKEMDKLPISPEDAIRKNSYCLALERVKISVNNLIEGRDFNDMGDKK